MPHSAAQGVGVRVTSRILRAGCVIVALRGELDIESAPALREELLGLLRPGTSRLIIDLSAVDYADASGAAVLVGTGRRAGLLGGWLRLAAPAPAVVTVLTVTGLNRHLATFATVEEAITGRHPDIGMVDARIGIPACKARIRPLHSAVGRARYDSDGGELRAAVGALLAHADAWRDADPRRRLAPSFAVLARAHAGTSNAALTQAAHSLLSVLRREPLTPSSEVAATASQLRRVLCPDNRSAAS
jgi:anti-sigma B factor antagonist